MSKEITTSSKGELKMTCASEEDPSKGKQPRNLHLCVSESERRELYEGKSRRGLDEWKNKYSVKFLFEESYKIPCSKRSRDRRGGCKRSDT